MSVIDISKKKYHLKGLLIEVPYGQSSDQDDAAKKNQLLTDRRRRSPTGVERRRADRRKGVQDREELNGFLYVKLELTESEVREFPLPRRKVDKVEQILAQNRATTTISKLITTAGLRAEDRVPLVYFLSEKGYVIMGEFVAQTRSA